MLLQTAFLSLLSVAVAVPFSVQPKNTNKTGSVLGISFDGSPSKLPILTLPYAKYRANSYHVDKDYYHFSNIRFAAPPVGDLRFAKPQPPHNETEIQDGSIGWACHQTESDALPSWFFDHNQPTSEDCLFLDVYVPGKVIRGEASGLPVMNWIYAGGYVFGSKDFFIYNTGMWVSNADNDMIYVSANHRMGAFGFLTGPTVEKEATSNVGFFDQRASLQWIRDHIHLVGGDNTEVTAWGLSSGAGSIMHHLTARGGKSDPLFHRAIMNSPAFVPTYDPAAMETSFNEFTKLLDCEGGGISCLRNVSEAALQNASAYTCINAETGKFGFGPAIDNDYILDLPGNELKKGNFWPNVSIMLSHTYQEGYIFTDSTINTNEKFDNYVWKNFPNMTNATNNELLTLYPPTSASTFSRLEKLISNWAVTCNTRWLAKAYEGQVWGYRFNVGPAIHGEDTFFNWLRLGLDLNIGEGLEFDIDILPSDKESIATIMQSYIASFARSGNPNTYRSKMTHPLALDVPLVNVTDTLNLLDIGNTTLRYVADEETPKDECDWWQSGAWTGRN